VKVGNAGVVGAAIGFAAAAACGAFLGLFFGMPTMDLPAKPGGQGLIWGTFLFSLVFGIPGAALGSFIGAFVAIVRKDNDKDEPGTKP
jgi:hypothetical protein